MPSDMNPIAAAAIRAVFARQCGNRANEFINPSGGNYNVELQLIYARIVSLEILLLMVDLLFILTKYGHIHILTQWLD